MSLHTISLANNIDPTDDPEEPPGIGEVPTLSSLCSSASTLLDRNVTASTSYLPPLLLEVALSLD